VICGEHPPGYEKVSASAQGSLASAAVTATCPAGRKVLGVGGSATFGSLHAVLDTIRPLPGLDGVKGVSASLSGAIGGAHIDGMSVFSIGVYAVARERPGGYRGSWKLEVFAVCAM
jgi:hypothetical protein